MIYDQVSLWGYIPWNCPPCPPTPTGRRRDGWAVGSLRVHCVGGRSHAAVCALSLSGDSSGAARISAWSSEQSHEQPISPGLSFQGCLYSRQLRKTEISYFYLEQTYLRSWVMKTVFSPRTKVGQVCQQPLLVVRGLLLSGSSLDRWHLARIASPVGVRAWGTGAAFLWPLPLL